MSISGTLLVVITASVLKPLLSSNQSLDLPTVALYDRYTGVLPDEESDLDLFLPQLVARTKNAGIDIKRQFDPWGGKRYSLFFTKDDISRKRQFSPWGGKRSDSESLSQNAGDKSITDELLLDNPAMDSISINKRSSNSLNTKRGFNSWGGKRSSAEEDIKKMFKSWASKRELDLWGKKRNFNAWGGKRLVKSLKEGSDDSYLGRENAKLSGKRQAFNSWGGKRSFNSWGGKRFIYIDPEVKEFRR